MDKPETGLVRAGGQNLITSQQSYALQLKKWTEEHVHLLCPVADFGALPEQFALVPAKVTINPDTRMGEVYRDPLFCKDGEVAISAIGLTKLAHCAGMSITTRRTDPSPRQAHYWEFQATARWRGLDGTIQERTATLEYDLRDGAERIRSFKPGQIAAARAHGARGAETRAINAVIRQLGIKQKYTQEELKTPFGMVRVVFQPDMNDPVQRAVVTQQAMQGTSTLYPAAPPPALVGEVIDSHPVDQSRRQTPATAAADTATTKSAPAAPPIDDSGMEGFEEVDAEPAKEQRYTVTKVQKQNRDGQAPIYFVLTRETGDKRLHTQDDATARAALAASKESQPVELVLETKGSDTWIVELRTITGTAAASTLPAGACFVTGISERKGTTPKKDDKPARPWTLFTITFSNGEEGKTFHESIAKTATEAKDKHLPVKPTLEASERYPDQQDLTALSIIDTRQGALPMESEL